MEPRSAATPPSSSITSATLWYVNPNASYGVSGAYGPYGGATARTLAIGPDNQARIVWTNVTGKTSVWNVTVAGSVTNYEFGL